MSPKPVTSIQGRAPRRVGHLRIPQEPGCDVIRVGTKVINRICSIVEPMGRLIGASLLIRIDSA
jgi:hypothetical protein